MRHSRGASPVHTNCSAGFLSISLGFGLHISQSWPRCGLQATGCGTVAFLNRSAAWKSSFQATSAKSFSVRNADWEAATVPRTPSRSRKPTLLRRHKLSPKPPCLTFAGHRPVTRWDVPGHRTPEMTTNLPTSPLRLALPHSSGVEILHGTRARIFM